MYTLSKRFHFVILDRCWCLMMMMSMQSGLKVKWLISGQLCVIWTSSNFPPSSSFWVFSDYKLCENHDLSPCSMLKTDSAIKKNKKLWNPLKLWIIRKPFLSSLIWRSLEMERKCFNQTFKTTVYYVISTPWLIYFFSWPMTSSHSPWMHKFYLPTQV